MNTWLQGWQVGLIGLLVVFAGFVLMGRRNRKKNINTDTSKPRQSEEPGIGLDLPASAAESDMQQTADDQAIAAAITAVIQCMLGAETDTPQGFIVRRIRRIA